MKPIFSILKNIRNLLPYFLLIAIYFLFINLETKNNKNNIRTFEKDKNLAEYETRILEEKPIRIRIPVIPYDQ